MTDLGRLHSNEKAFFILNKAGERGNAEAHFLIAQMIREGFLPFALGKDLNDEQFWLLKVSNYILSHVVFLLEDSMKRVKSSNSYLKINFILEYKWIS